MKRVLFLCMMAVLFVGCSKDDGQTVEMTIASDGCVVTNWGENIFTPVYLAKTDSNQNEWVKYSVSSFENFEYTRGFEYRLKVRKVSNGREGLMDTEGISYNVEKVLEKREAVSEGLPEDMAYTTEKIVASQTRIPDKESVDHYIWKGTGTQDAWQFWAPAGNVSGFEYQQGYEYKVKVHINAVLDDSLNISGYEYKVLEILEKNQSASIDLDKAEHILPY